jgi:CBS domain-containing protein
VKVEHVMSKDVRACRPTDTLSTAARTLWEHDCGAVPVVEGDGSGHVVGMLTDRDVCMAAYTQGRSLCDLSVGSAMSHAPITCAPSNTLEEAAALMQRAQVRRLPVVDESNQLLGVLSLADFAHEARRRTKATARTAAWALVGEALDAITQPRTA